MNYLNNTLIANNINHINSDIFYNNLQNLNNLNNYIINDDKKLLNQNFFQIHPINNNSDINANNEGS